MVSSAWTCSVMSTTSPRRVADPTIELGRTLALSCHQLTLPSCFMIRYEAENEEPVAFERRSSSSTRTRSSGCRQPAQKSGREVQSAAEYPERDWICGLT